MRYLYLMCEADSQMLIPPAFMHTYVDADTESEAYERGWESLRHYRDASLFDTMGDFLIPIELSGRRVRAERDEQEQEGEGEGEGEEVV